MKRKYLVKSFGPFRTVEDFQRTCDELSEKGWFLQEFHGVGQTAGIYAVFYKDEESK